LKTLRRVTQPPRLVETVTSGEVVTIRAASSVSPRASSPMIRPNASWVEVSAACRPVGSSAGTGTGRRVVALGALAEGDRGDERVEILAATSRPA
jgi:hypothetical protein